jgi:hypothetical protein
MTTSATGPGVGAEGMRETGPYLGPGATSVPLEQGQ